MKEGDLMKPQKHPGGRPAKQIEVPADRLPQKDFFTVAEVAELTGCHIHTIQSRLRDGSLKGKKLGKSWKIYREELVKSD